MLQNDLHRPWPVKQRIQSRHGHLSNAAAAAVLEEIIPAGRVRRVVLGHLSRDCNTPALASGAIEALLEKSGRSVEPNVLRGPGADQSALQDRRDASRRFSTDVR